MKIIWTKYALAFGVLFFIHLPIVLFAEIIVSSFHSDVIVKVNRSLEVRETILINVEGTVNQQEIYRHIPVQFMTPQGIKTRVSLKVGRVLLDGSPQPFTVRNNGRYKKVHISNSARPLNHGPHTFVFEYDIGNQVRFNDNYDEIYWNITGTNRELRILNASVKIIFPSGSEIISSTAFTGQSVNSGCDCSVGPDRKNIWEGFITNPLYPSMNWGVTVRFTKGYVLPVSSEEIRSMVMKRKRIFYAGIGGVISVMLLYFMSWLINSGNNKSRNIIPKSAPPAGYSPDLCRYIKNDIYDQKSFTVLIIQLAVKGALTLSRDDETYLLRKADILPANLNRTETGVIGKIFKTGNTYRLGSDDFCNIREAINYHEKVLHREKNRTHLHFNGLWIAPGLLGSLASLVLMNAWIFIYNPESFNFTIILSFAALAMIPVIIITINHLRAASTGYKIAILTAQALCIFFLLITISGFVTFILKDTDLDWNLIPFYCGILSVLLLAGLVFSYVAGIRTERRIRFMNHLDGLKQYLKVIENEKLALINKPVMTVRHFENLLPYAFALDAEDSWSVKFEKIMNQTMQSGYPVIAWYYGYNRKFNASGFSNEIRYSLQSALSAAYYPAG